MCFELYCATSCEYVVQYNHTPLREVVDQIRRTGLSTYHCPVCKKLTIRVRQLKKESP